jgi:uncharacterized membrane protein
MGFRFILFTTFIIFLLLILLTSVYFQYQNVNEKYKFLFITICIISIYSTIFTYHDRYLFETEDYKNWTPCDDKDRICWRRSIMLGFFCFLLVNYVYPKDTLNNIVLYALFIFIFYFYFNWDQFHRYRCLCKEP